jgi:hypothetical protein
VVRFGEDEEVPTTANWIDPGDALFLRKETSSESPILWARWLFVQQARQRNLFNRDDSGLGYYDWLGIRKRADYLKLIDIDVKSPDEVQFFGTEFRAARDRSGVSEQNRIVVRFRGRAEAGVWVTLDTKDQRRRGVALRNLGPGDFEHDTEEWIGPGNNHLPKYLLSDNRGVLQNVAPGDDHGLHDTSAANEARSRALHPNLSCLGCHKGDIIIPFRDDVRAQYYAGGFLAAGVAATYSPPVNPYARFAKRKKAAPYKPYLKRPDRVQAFLEFRRLYLSDVYYWMSHDIGLYRRAVGLATRLDAGDTGLAPDAATAAYARAFHHYATDPVTPARAARELGVPAHVWIAALRHYARPRLKSGVEVNLLADTALARHLQKEPLALTRLTWEDSYALAQDILHEYAATLAPRKGDEKTWFRQPARYFACVPLPRRSSPSPPRQREVVTATAGTDTGTTPIRPTATPIPPTTTATPPGRSSGRSSSRSAFTGRSILARQAWRATSSRSRRRPSLRQAAAQQQQEEPPSPAAILPGWSSSPRGSRPASPRCEARCPVCALWWALWPAGWTAWRSVCAWPRPAWAPRFPPPRLPLALLLLALLLAGERLFVMEIPAGPRPEERWPFRMP